MAFDTKRWHRIGHLLSIELWESTDFVKQINDFLLQHGFARARGTVGLASLCACDDWTAGMGQNLWTICWGDVLGKYQRFCVLTHTHYCKLMPILDFFPEGHILAQTKSRFHICAWRVGRNTSLAMKAAKRFSVLPFKFLLRQSKEVHQVLPSPIKQSNMFQRGILCICQILATASTVDAPKSHPTLTHDFLAIPWLNN